VWEVAVEALEGQTWVVGDATAEAALEERLSIVSNCSPVRKSITHPTLSLLVSTSCCLLMSTSCGLVLALLLPLSPPAQSVPSCCWRPLLPSPFSAECVSSPFLPE